MSKDWNVIFAGAYVTIIQLLTQTACSPKGARGFSKALIVSTLDARTI